MVVTLIMADTNASAGTSSGEGAYTVPFLIGGDEMRSDKTFDVVNPATGKAVHKQVPPAPGKPLS